MDTRAKIVSAAEAARLAKSGATVVSGFFDPLTAEHAARLQGLRQSDRPLLVLIASEKTSILPASARAELVAGLAAVDYVAELTDEIQPDARLEAEDRARQARLIQHVRMRQGAASTAAGSSAGGSSKPRSTE